MPSVSRAEGYLCVPQLPVSSWGGLGLKLVLELVGYCVLGGIAFFFPLLFLFVGLVAPGASRLLGTQGRQLAFLTGVFPSSSSQKKRLLSCRDGGGMVLTSVG